MKTIYISLGMVCLLALLRWTGVWHLAWGWITAPVWGPLVGAIGLVVWVKYKTRGKK